MIPAPNEGGGGEQDADSRAALDPGFERRLVVLMGARLGLSLLSLAVTLGLEAAGEPHTTAEWRGFYATVAFAFLATIVYGLMLNRVVRPQRFAALNVVTDVGIVTALVHFSGGHDSVFPFLYVLVATYGAFLFEFRGSFATALLAVLAYGSVLLAGYQGWIPDLAIGPREPPVVILTKWVITSGAVVVVSILASVLTAELRRTGAALYKRTTDLLRLQNLHQRTVESLMSGLLTTDEEFRVTSFNPEAERITSIRSDEAVGRDVESVIPGLRELSRAASEAPEAHRPRSRMVYRNRRGDSLHLGLAVYILRDADSEPSGFVVIFQDVTKVVGMERDLRRSERLAAVGELSASIAHEVRNPLAAISGSIQVLRGHVRDDSGSDEPRRLMDIVLRETDRLNRLITDFLVYARPGPSVMQRVEVAAVVEDVLKMFEAVVPEAVTVETAMESGLCVIADPSQLRQVLWNLVLNSAEAMPQGGRLLISSARTVSDSPQGVAGGNRNEAVGHEKGSWAEITVKDDGSGVSEPELERVFDPFFTTKEHGSGLGLAAVHRIVEEHGGSVHLESSASCGTSVRLTLPRDEDGS